MNREQYKAGPAKATLGPKDAKNWTVVLVRELPQPPDKVWRAITEPDQIKEWAPFDASRNLDEVGTVQLTTVGAPENASSESQITRADAPHTLEYQWGGGEVRWQLEPVGEGTRLTLSASINRRFIGMGAAGWHICLDVLGALLDGDPIGRIVAGDALKFGDWQRLNQEYSEQFGVEPISW